jgi:hypothetical protein
VCAPIKGSPARRNALPNEQANEHREVSKSRSWLLRILPGQCGTIDAVAVDNADDVIATKQVYVELG